MKKIYILLILIGLTLSLSNIYGADDFASAPLIDTSTPLDAPPDVGGLAIVANGDIASLDLTKAGGIAVIVGLLMIWGNRLYRRILSEKLSKFLTVFTVAILCLVFSYLSYLAGYNENETIKDTLVRGLSAWFITIGGYEGIKRMLQLFIKEDV